MKNFTDLSVLIAGCGSIGKRHARVLHRLGTSDIRACDPVPAQGQPLAAETQVRLFASYEEGLASRPDTVFLCTPPSLHIPMALQAMAAGAHVFSEKPLSDGSAGIDKLQETAVRSGKSVMTGLCFRYHEGLRRAKHLLEKGDFGRLVSIRCLMGENLPTVRPDYRTLYSFRYGGAFDLMHEIDLAVWFAGSQAKEVRCLAGSCSDIGFIAPDLAEILLEFKNRVMAGIHLDFFQMPRRRQTELICTRGVIIVEFARWDACTVSTAGADGVWSRQEMKTERDDMFRDEDRSFLEAVAAGRPVECGIPEARESVEIMEKAQRAAGLTPGFRP